MQSVCVEDSSLLGYRAVESCRDYANELSAALTTEQPQIQGGLRYVVGLM